jgi:hypothetical protein
VTRWVARGRGTAVGPVTVASRRRFALAGWVQTSAGRVDTRIVESVAFSSRQRFDLGPARSVQGLRQTATVAATTTMSRGPIVVVRRRSYAYPLSITLSRRAGPDGSASELTAVHQARRAAERVTRNGRPVFWSAEADDVAPSDRVRRAPGGRLAGPGDSRSRQTYAHADSRGRRWRRTVTAAGGVLTGVSGGAGR